MKMDIIGWDIGGAHVKAAVVDARGRVVAVIQHPCPLWKGIAFLEEAVNILLSQFPRESFRHVITMTGELVDLFDNRDHGVSRIIESMSALLPYSDLQFYAGPCGFLPNGSVKPEHYSAIASANWLASASYVAGKLGDGLFIDVGSTTTDIILLSKGLVKAEGHTDYQRLVSGELVYTGIVRTAVMAVAQEASFKGCRVGLMAEHFATMADVYRMTGELNESHDQAETADGAEKTVSASARRLSRMIGYDFEANGFDDWKQFARGIRSQQLHQIQLNCERQLSRCRLTPEFPFIGAGVGRFLVKQLAVNLGFDYIDFNELLPHASTESAMTSADCAPALSIALLAQLQMGQAG